MMIYVLLYFLYVALATASLAVFNYSNAQFTVCIYIVSHLHTHTVLNARHSGVLFILGFHVCIVQMGCFGSVFCFFATDLHECS